MPGPPFPCNGKWVRGGNLGLHLIHADPSVPKKFRNWTQKYNTTPEPWFVRRADHLALEVADINEAESLLQEWGIDYDKFEVPGYEDCKQLFFFDPDGHGVEIGNFAALTI
eukprot:TRINITY_DN4098_c0_g1_i2.p4 TRINITY_DN4098_c0_g1~~TRINITY_DN4098_c0_g1_i2.p4  ORF type:complete len:111 (-),score=14.09 TRINITY_DN4098_c0_g1_i2:443-775(-)